MKLQQPRNYDFRVSQFDPPRSQSGNDRETMTSPPGHHWEADVALTTTAKLQQLRDNSREMTTFAESGNDREMQRPWNDKLEAAQLLQILRQILRRFVAVVVSSALWKSLNFWSTGNGHFKQDLGSVLRGGIFCFRSSENGFLQSVGPLGKVLIRFLFFWVHLVAPCVQSSIALEDAVENRGLYRVFASRLF